MMNPIQWTHKIIYKVRKILENPLKMSNTNKMSKINLIFLY